MLLLLPLLGACTSAPPVPEPAPAMGPVAVGIGELVAELKRPRAEPRVYNFWATWCGPCMAEMPALRRFGKENPEVTLVFVNVDLPSLRDTKVRATRKRMKLEPFEHLDLQDDDPAFALNQVEGWPNSLPVTLVVDRSGDRVHQFNTRIDEKMLARVTEPLR